MKITFNTERNPYTSWTVKISNNEEYPANFGVIQTPTGNCQLASISHMDTILSKCSTKKDMVDVMKTVYNYTSKKMLLVDVVETVETLDEPMQKFFGRDIMVKTPYISTRGTRMITYLLNIERMITENKSLT